METKSFFRVVNFLESWQWYPVILIFILWYQHPPIWQNLKMSWQGVKLDRLPCFCSAGLWSGTCLPYSRLLLPKMSHTKKVDPVLNQSMRTISGKIKSTFTHWLHVLSHILQSYLCKNTLMSRSIERFKVTYKFPSTTWILVLIEIDWNPNTSL